MHLDAWGGSLKRVTWGESKDRRLSEREANGIEAGRLCVSDEEKEV